MTLTNGNEKISYQQFREQWLTEIEEAGLSTLDKGRRFGSKLITQWLDITTDDEDFFICDGSGDGGIDIAYLKWADIDPDTRDDNSEEDDTWYIVQSKYGTSFSGYSTISLEGQKVIETLLGDNEHLSADSKRLLDKLKTFQSQASAADRIVLVFATTDPIAQSDRPALDTIKQEGRELVFENFDVEEVSLRTIWEPLTNEPEKLAVSINGQFVEQGYGLLVGTVSLVNLFEFLKSYLNKTGNLDQLYEKNIRQFLGSRRKINKGIQTTLNENPEKFGLYNNGITLVVSRYSEPTSDGTITVNDPYVVNGCQTTRTIWQVLDGKFNSGGTGQNPDTEDWKQRAYQGGVVTKIVKSEEAEIANITRFTNSQNAVRAQDFIAIESGFQNWAAEMEKDYGIYLEIQRGGTESQKAYEKQHPEQPKFDDYVSAFDLVKVYGAGWLESPGLAFGKNAPFLHQGSVYQRMMSRSETEPAFGTRDLYAAHRVKCLADNIGFGRNAANPSRRQSRFLFYYIIMKMLRQVILLKPELGEPVVTTRVLTEAIVKLATAKALEPLDTLSRGAIALLDQYLTAGNDISVHKEESFTTVHNGNLNGFLKAENLGTEHHSPLLLQSLAIQNAAFNMSGGTESVAKALLES